MSKPFVAVLNRKWKFQRCDFCFEAFPPGSELPRPVTCQTCSACLYCNEECREAALEDHREECRYFRQKGKSLISDTARFVLKLILKVENRRGLTEDISILDVRRTFNDLLDHADSIRKDEIRMKTIRAIYAELEKYEFAELAQYDFGNFVKLCGKVMINSFHYTDEYNKVIGTGLFLGASCLDHSCLPNVGFSFAKGNIELRALESIEFDPTIQFAEEVFKISYVDLMDSTRNRKRNLLNGYYFLCQCPRCSDPSYEMTLYCLRCRNVKCSGRPVYVGMGVTLEELNPSPCPNCEMRPSVKALEAYISVCAEAQAALSNGSENGIKRSTDELLSIMTGFLHPDHYLYTRTAKRALEENTANGDYEKAREFGLLCLNSYRKYKSHVWPAFGQLLLKVGKLELTRMKELPKTIAKVHLAEAVEVIAVTHGREHTLFKEAEALLRQASVI